jgi:MinD-like ATPase involved in chromosome partitioning or flagellar assembly
MIYRRRTGYTSALNWRIQKMDLINYLSNKKIIIVCGHYGSGKTNISVNLSLKLKQQTGLIYTLVDLDIVNPYFRSADNIKDLTEHGIDFIIPEFANTNVDLPAIPAAIYSIFTNNRRAVIDVGGDERGAVALGMFAEKIAADNYEMIYVVNKYRNLTSDVEQAVNLAKFIEKNSKLKITSLINNSNIGYLTTEKEILNSVIYAQNAANLLNIYFLGTSSMIDVDFSVEKEYNIFKINNYTKKLF